ncbi:ABC transporter ATP-binding protein [bacterium AH-315-F03]|nr:ABC transporter ATP-binding protein [bacterium AH-315-F03]MBN4076501.1 ABC transporter ATP-binding protein [Gemmatimonas aurantiaca]
MITFSAVSKSYDNGATFAVQDLTLDISTGELVALVGESGSGKTTTLKMINRLVEPSAGTISVAGQDILSLDCIMHRRSIGYVFQGIGLFPHLTVAQNISVVPELLGWAEANIAARTTELLTLVGLTPSEFALRFPNELSGGQQQRVGVARALAARPKLILMDEPFGALDPITRANLRRELKAIHKSTGVTIVLVTHDMTEALQLADRIAVMRDGKVLQYDTPRNVIQHPADKYVRRLLQTPLNEVAELNALLQADQPDMNTGP